MFRESHHLTDQHGCYYLTFNVVDWVDVFIRPVYKQIIVDTLNFLVASRGLEVYAWCLMSNHLHLVCRSTREEGISSIERDFKKETTKRILSEIDVEPDIRRNWMMERFEKFCHTLKRKEKFNLWQSCTNPVHIRMDEESDLQHYIHHVHDNPVRDGIVNKPEDYMYSSARDYSGTRSQVNLMKMLHFSHPFYHGMLSRENGN